MSSVDLTIQDEEGYLHAIVTGENTPENLLTYLAKIHLACVDRERSSVLIEANLRGPTLELRDIFEIVSVLSQTAERTVRRIAYVDVNPAHEGDRPKMEFAGNVATGLGIDVRVFRTVAEARQWLIDRTSAPPKSQPPG